MWRTDKCASNPYAWNGAPYAYLLAAACCKGPHPLLRSQDRYAGTQKSQDIYHNTIAASGDP